nr:hypothetical protein [uncultured bacterium]
MEGIVFVARLVLGSVFLMASLTKLPRVESFSGEIQQYKILPPFVARLTARVLPLVELTLALAFLSGSFTQVAGLAAAILMTTFILAAASAIRRKLYVGCACFGLLFRMPISHRTMGRDIVLLGMAAIVSLKGPAVPSIVDAVSDFSSLWHLSLLVITALATSACLWAVYLANRGRLFLAEENPQLVEFPVYNVR